MAASWLASARRTELSGMPAYVADVPGRATAMLVFRVGYADATLADHGLAHLVEHLVTSGFGPRDGVGGVVMACVTVIGVEGRPEEVGGKLGEIASTLGALPVDRLRVESRVLGVEAGDVGSFDAEGQLLGLRYGACGPGLVAAEELGLLNVTEQGVQAHADRWFTRGNAALVATAPFAGADELELPEGPWMPAHTFPQVAVERLPAWAPSTGPMLLGATLPVGLASSLLGSMLELWAWRELRQRRGLIYDVRVTNRPVGPREGALHLMTDASGHDAGAAARLTIDAINAWAEDRIDDQLLASAHEDLARRIEDGPEALLMASAIGELVHGNQRSPRQRADAVRSVDRAKLVAQARLLRDRLIVTVPEEHAVGLLTPLRLVATPTVTGRRFTHLTGAGGPDEVDLLVGAEGVTRLSDPPTTVRYDACAAAIFGFDGSVDLVATSGQRILIDPSQLQDGRDAIAAIRRALDPELIVERPVTFKPLAARPYGPGGRIIVRNPRADR